MIHRIIPFSVILMGGWGKQYSLHRQICTAKGRYQDMFLTKGAFTHIKLRRVEGKTPPKPCIAPPLQTKTNRNAAVGETNTYSTCAIHNYVRGNRSYSSHGRIARSSNSSNRLNLLPASPITAEARPVATMDRCCQPSLHATGPSRYCQPFDPANSLLYRHMC